MVLGFARPPRKRGGLVADEYESLVTRLRADAGHVASHFHLPAFVLDADRPSSKSRYGICYADGRILVRFVHATTGRPLKYSALIDTVVHELAHLRHLDHGPRWEACYQQMLEWCREQGIYEPRELVTTDGRAASTETPRPVQLGLFPNALSRP